MQELIQGFEKFNFLILYFSNIQNKANEVINLINKDNSKDVNKIKENLNT
jgi:hypothetical protein